MSSPCAPRIAGCRKLSPSGAWCASRICRRRSILGVEPAELLDALTGRDLRRVEVALPVYGDVMQCRELAGLAADAPETAEAVLRGTVDDADFAVRPVDHVDEFL